MVERRSSKKTTAQLGNKEDQNPRKFYSRFLFKALILAVFCSIVPAILSQTPELSNQTRLLELLHLVFVGLAVSYGLFSRRRNYDGGGGSSDHDHSNTNNPHVCVPKLLEVSSSVFNVGHESESEPSDDSSGDHRKIQTWRNKYQMKSPEVVLSRENQSRFVDRVSSGVRGKPLLLPVRSLNYSRVSDHSGGGPWEKVRSKRELLKSLGDDDNNDVLPSPIPWRSRSSSSSSTETPIKNLAMVESQPLIKTPASLTSSSPRKSAPLPELTTDSGVVETDEDTVRKQRFRPSPPPPPPPPLPAFYNSASRKDNSTGVKRIVEARESVQKKKFSGGEFRHPPPPPPPPPPPMDYYKSPPPTKLRASSERRKTSEQKMKRNSPKKVWWSDPIAESKELRVTREDSDGRGFLGSKEAGESEDEERRRREAEVHEDDEHSEIGEKKKQEEGACGNISDVDKKADEFIAKFREQIRLQRIESIKRSTNKISSHSSK